MGIYETMKRELKSKELFDQARSYAYEYMDGIEAMDVYPSDDNIKKMDAFDEAMPLNSISAKAVIQQLHKFGSPATIAQTGGRYFGFVNGGALPVSLGVKWLSDVWDQCGGLYLTSPINAKLESICENWLKKIFNLPKETVAGFVSGTSTANLSAMAAARYQLLKNQGWDVNEKGIHGSPPLRIIAQEQAHTSVKKSITLLGYGKQIIEWVPADDQGRIVVEKLPKLDSSCLILLQAGNVNTGAFDDFDTVCDLANQAGAWVHIDGAFGLWAAATKSLSHLTRGIEKASSWACDGHKTLNTPYDSGIVLCKHPNALISALQATGEYLTFSDQRDPILYTPEMSKRSRAIELWAVMKYLGRDGIDEMVTTFNKRAQQLASGLSNLGYTILNDIVFNQVLLRAESDDKTKHALEFIQKSGECWVGGSSWQGKTAIRVSICSWATTEADIAQTIETFKKALG